VLIQTERLLLREVEESDFDAIHAYASDPEVVEHMAWGPNTEQATRDFITNCRSKIQSDPRLEYVVAVVPKGQSELVGTVGIYLPSGHAHSAMLGYAFGREVWAMAIASEAVRPMLEVAFDVLRLDRVWASCDPDNGASARVLQKLGMSLEGHLRHDQNIRGVLRDSLVWGMLRNEWLNPFETEEFL